MINPDNPLYNTIIFYILIMCIILMTKPSIMYCNKTNKFKSFGCGVNQTLLSFPTASMTCGILLYLFFLGIEIMNNYLS
jgi:hypothetical protein